MKPEKLLESTDCLAQALHVSDQEATILLRTTEYDKVVRSLFRLRLTPIFREAFAPFQNNNILGLKPDKLGAGFCPHESSRIMEFLTLLKYQVDFEAGVDCVNYYKATPKTSLWDIVANKYSITRPVFNIEVVSPATDDDIQRVLPATSCILIHETPQLYNQIVFPFIQDKIESRSNLSWVDNILSSSTESKRFVFHTDDYVLLVDTKWPSANSCMLSHSKLKLCHDDKKDIQYLVLVRDESLASIRDLRSRHIPLLNDILRRCPPILEEIYGIPVNQLRIFVQYHPQFFRFHVLLNHIENEVGCSTERGHLVSDIVQNLEMDGEYYCNRTLAYKIRSDDSLYHAIQMVEMVREVTLPLLEGT